ncbi:mucin-associated surface protein [Arthrobacter sp. ISL-72]|nr:mucin-associated surface protein [Arthrobacter sp. ISL-72]
MRGLRLPQLPRWKTAFAAGLVAAALTGCSPAVPDLDPDAAKQLQANVLSVSRSAAGQDAAGALKSLDELVALLDAAAAEGRVSFKRHQSIMKAVDAVRADLAAAQAQAKAEAEAAAAAEAAAQAAAAAAAAASEASQAAVPPVVVAPEPAPAPAGQNPGGGKGEKGKDKDD